MQRLRFVGLTLVMAACAPGEAPGVAASDTAATLSDVRPEEHRAVQETIDAFYEASSFADIAQADPEGFRTPFISTATLGYVRDDALVTRTVDDYVAIRRGMVERGEPQSLVEAEIGGTTELFGDIAHRVSAYDVRVDGAEDPVERGVMSFQLVRVAGEWKILSLIWHTETPERLIPVRYLLEGESP